MGAHGQRRQWRGGGELVLEVLEEAEGELLRIVHWLRDSHLYQLALRLLGRRGHGSERLGVLICGIGVLLAVGLRLRAHRAG